MVLLTNPIWLIKTRMQLQLREKIPTSHATLSTSSVSSPTGSEMLSKFPSDSSLPLESEFEKRRRQLQQRNYSGLLDAVRTILREEGIFGFYKGIVPALMLVSHGACQFVFYEAIKEELKPSAPWHFLLIGASSKMAASIITYPYQVFWNKLEIVSWHCFEGSSLFPTRLSKLDCKISEFTVRSCVLRMCPTTEEPWTVFRRWSDKKEREVCSKGA